MNKLSLVVFLFLPGTLTAQEDRPAEMDILIDEIWDLLADGKSKETLPLLDRALAIAPLDSRLLALRTSIERILALRRDTESLEETEVETSEPLKFSLSGRSPPGTKEPWETRGRAFVLGGGMWTREGLSFQANDQERNFLGFHVAVSYAFAPFRRVFGFSAEMRTLFPSFGAKHTSPTQSILTIVRGWVFARSFFFEDARKRLIVGLRTGYEWLSLSGNSSHRIESHTLPVGIFISVPPLAYLTSQSFAERVLLSGEIVVSLELRKFSVKTVEYGIGIGYRLPAFFLGAHYRINRSVMIHFHSVDFSLRKDW